jgi:Zn-dependent protease with chaperone function
MIASTARDAADPGRFGPPDRVSFLAEQKRRRRETWRLSALCAAAVLVTGLPLSVVLTPAAYAALLGALRVAGLPAAARAALQRYATLVPRLFDALGGHAGVPLAQAIGGGLIVVAPGVIASLVLWLALRSLFVRAGTGGVLLTLRAREVRHEDPEEHQLANLVEEMAIAGGVPPPRVLILDTPAANAGVLGSSPRDAAVVATRGMLDTLDRSAKEAVVGHLVGSIGNGDLRIAVTITSTFHSMAFVLTALEAFIGWSGTAWKELGETLRWALSQRGDAAATEAVSEMLAREIGRTSEDGIAAVISDSPGGEARTALARAARRFPPLKVLLLPLYLPYLVVLFLRMEIFMLRAFVVGPLVMLVWRTRRYLADAMAVQLTRDPDGLARALERLATMDTTVPNSQWASHLFVVSSMPRRSQETGGDSDSAELGGVVGSHPPLARRLKRLAAMGSDLAAGGVRAPRRLGAGGLVALLVVGPLVVLAGALMLAALAMAFALAGGASLMFAGVAMALIARFLL